MEIKKEVKSDKNHKFSISFSKSTTKISIKATEEQFSTKFYSNEFTEEKIKENKYFIQFDNLEEIYKELVDRINNSNTNLILIENECSLLLSVPLPSSKIKEIIFELKQTSIKNDDLIKELMNLILEQKSHIAQLKEELNTFKQDTSCLLKNYIINLNSIIVDNNNDNTTLKNWISPDKTIRANLLYRKSRDGPEKETYHKLCDNKGSLLHLFHLTQGYKVGYYSSKSCDSASKWVEDENLFIFNLEKKTFRKYAKKSLIYCSKDCGCSANGLGCNLNVNLNYLYFNPNFLSTILIGDVDILPNKGEEELVFEVKETEIFQIIIK